MVNHLFESLFERLNKLPRDLPEIILEITLEIIISVILAIVVQFGWATISRAILITILTILSLHTAGIGSAAYGSWQDALIFGTSFGLMLFAPMFELPYAYVHWKARLPRESEEIEQDIRDNPFGELQYGGEEPVPWPRSVSVEFPPSLYDNVLIIGAYILILLISVPLILLFALPYLHLALPGTLSFVILPPTVLGFAGWRGAHARLRQIKLRAEVPRRARQFSVPAALIAEKKRTWQIFIRAVFLFVAIVALILLSLMVFFVRK
jgi:hypothetical protein